MEILTKLFGTINVEEDKVITFDNGIIGFSDMKRFMLIHDAEQEESIITWLQSLDEPAFAMPVMSPLVAEPNYDPFIEDELLSSLQPMENEDMLVLVTVTVPKNVEDMTCNLAAPIIINAANRKACQVLAEGNTYAVKHPVYEALKAGRE